MDAMAERRVITVAQVDLMLNEHFAKLLEDEDQMEDRILQFHRDGYTKFEVNRFVPETLFRELRTEVLAMVQNHGIRRDMLMQTTSDSPRYMSTVPQSAIEAQGTVVPTIYNSGIVRQYLGRIARDDLKSCVKEEEYIVAKLEKKNDTHGWHWGDYPYTVIWIVEAPHMDKGGLLQCVPHTYWDKHNPRVNWYLANNDIRSYFHETGEVYFLKSDTTLHRVTPMEADDTRRIILNTCWASTNDIRGNFEHETLNAAFL